ncbi:MAG: FAD-dependent oxidoreductase [Actinomycetales bacterium]
MPQVLICGAGWAGMNAARLLQERGFSVKILEKSERVGGRISTDFKEGFTLDRGFQVINPSYAELREAGALAGLVTTRIPKGIEILRGDAILKAGDPRSDLRYLPTLWRKEFGGFREKLEFLKFLRQPTSDISFGAAMAKSKRLFIEVLKPFLDGVVLGDVTSMSNRVVRELIHWFIKGTPVLIEGGVARASENLAAGLDIDFGVEILAATERKVTTDQGELSADAVVVATDPITATKLLGLAAPVMNFSQTWYFDLPIGVVTSKHLRVGGQGPITNSIALSNLIADYAPAGRTLLAATCIEKATESAVRVHLSQLWGVSVDDWRLIECIDIPNSLPRMLPGSPLIATQKVNGVWLAGDWCATPSQQGALLSGKLVANLISASR